MASLVDYSSSSSEDFEDDPTSAKRFKLPDLLHPQNSDQNGTAEHHDGRIRSVPHIRGNWASYVYIPITSNSTIDELQIEIISFCKTYDLELRPCPEPELHISLTRLLILKHHWIDAICESVKQVSIQRRQFGFQFDRLQIYCNDERTRTFIGVTVFEEDTAQLQDLVTCYDNCLTDYKLPKYYDPPSFHYSILWCLGDHELELRNRLPALNGILRQYLGDDISDYTETVKKIYFKCGNRLYNYQLKE